MITRRTKVQLLVFVIITLVGVTYVGARYARLDRVFFDDHYTVVAHFSESGGIFSGAVVTYRGVKIGQVGDLELTDNGVDVHLDIDNGHDSIPADSLAIVGNRSAVGEQYVELQPQEDGGPFLHDGAEIATASTRTPIATETLLGNLATTVGSVDRDALATTVAELGAAFGGTGEDLQRIIDTGNSFIEAANENFDVTTSLIRESNTVLEGQVDSAGALRTFARDLSLFTGSLAASDDDLNRLIDVGSAGARQLRTFIEENEAELGDMLNNLRTVGEVGVANIDGFEQMLVIYPYVVEGTWTVVTKSPDTGLYDAHFGLMITDKHVCTQGYEATDTRPPQDTGNRPMNTEVGCTEPPSVSNARGSQNLQLRRPPASYDGSPVAAYDPETGEFTFGERVPRVAPDTGTVAPASLGEESWKWLFLQPLVSTRD